MFLGNGTITLCKASFRVSLLFSFFIPLPWKCRLIPNPIKYARVVDEVIWIFLQFLKVDSRVDRRQVTHPPSVCLSREKEPARNYTRAVANEIVRQGINRFSARVLSPRRGLEYVVASSRTRTREVFHRVSKSHREKEASFRSNTSVRIGTTCIAMRTAMRSSRHSRKRSTSNPVTRIRLHRVFQGPGWLE